MPALQPTYSRADLDRVLLEEAEIAARVAQLGHEISRHYGDTDVTVVCVLSGAMIFTADLLRHLRFPTRLDAVRAESYSGGSVSTGAPTMDRLLKTDIANRHVLVVDDILDTGHTLQTLMRELLKARPASLSTCVLLDKEARRQVPVEADFVGFRIPDAFVVGYGLDFAERYRSLRCIGALKDAFQNPDAFA